MKFEVIQVDTKCRLGDLQAGSLFMYAGTIALKTEYGIADCYIIGSGETFIAGQTNEIERAKLLVTPLIMTVERSVKELEKELG